NFSDLTFFGGSSGFVSASGNVAAGDTETGVFVRYQNGAAGTIDRVAFGGIFANGFGGFATSATGAGTSLTVQNSTLGSIGRVGANPGTGTPIDATHVWWGTPTGPFNPTTNPGGTGNPVAARVVFAPVATGLNPVIAAPTLPTYLAAAFPPPTVTVAVIA